MKTRDVKEALTPDFEYPESYLVWGLRLVLVGFFLYGVLVPDPVNTSRQLLLGGSTAGLLASVAFAFIPTGRPRTLKAAQAAVLGFVIFHVGGHAFGFYKAFDWYDKALHFVVPLVTALVIYALSQATDWIWDWRRVSPIEVGIYLFSMTLAIGALWEIMEFGMDTLAGTEEQEGLDDTMIDLVMGASGALLGAFGGAAATYWGRRHGFDGVSEDRKPTTRGGGPSRHARERAQKR